MAGPHRALSSVTNVQGVLTDALETDDGTDRYDLAQGDSHEELGEGRDSLDGISPPEDTTMADVAQRSDGATDNAEAKRRAEEATGGAPARWTRHCGGEESTWKRLDLADEREDGAAPRDDTAKVAGGSRPHRQQEQQHGWGPQLQRTAAAAKELAEQQRHI